MWIKSKGHSKKIVEIVHSIVKSPQTKKLYQKVVSKRKGNCDYEGTCFNISEGLDEVKLSHNVNGF